MVHWKAYLKSKYGTLKKAAEKMGCSYDVVKHYKHLPAHRVLQLTEMGLAKKHLINNEDKKK